MKSKVTFNGQSYTEENVESVVMTDFTCTCGNPMYIPLGAVVLGLTTSCGHCTAKHGYPKEQHCAALTEGWITLIEDGDICLD
jgi:hypothetical protein